MLQIECSGTPYEIGFKHGSLASTEIKRCIDFYASLFLKTSKQTWDQVKETASGFDSEINSRWPRYHEELRGVADGSQRDLLDIIAINVRTEIAFGLFSDGCTSLYHKTKDHTFLGQNWDWWHRQRTNLILLTIIQPHLPTIKMVTEAGLIGKIGLNSHGVGVVFNAIRAKGVSSTHMPVHLGLRRALESTSAAAAVSALEEVGMASSAHILIGDREDATGLEFTSTTFARLRPDEEGVVVHSNHLVGDHGGGVVEPRWLEDSLVRIERMRGLAGEFEDDESGDSSDGLQGFGRLFEDEEGKPGAICRSVSGREGDEVETLFNIVMDLREKRAIVRVGRPTESEESIQLSF